MCTYVDNVLFSQYHSQSDHIMIDGDQFHTTMDNSYLWNDTSNYTQWITNLVTSLLKSGGVTDEVLLLIASVCEVKVNKDHIKQHGSTV